MQSEVSTLEESIAELSEVCGSVIPRLCEHEIVLVARGTAGVRWMSLWLCYDVGSTDGGCMWLYYSEAYKSEGIGTQLFQIGDLLIWHFAF